MTTAETISRITGLFNDTVLESDHELTVELWPVGRTWQARLVDYGGTDRAELIEVDGNTLDQALTRLLYAAETWAKERLEVAYEQCPEGLTPYYATLAHY